MKINNDNTEVQFSFTPNEYFLIRSNDNRFGEVNPPKVWTLNPRIDRSEKGKNDDMAVATIYLSDDEAKMCKDAGFSYIEE